MLASVDWGAVGTVSGLLLAIFGALIRIAVVATRLLQRVEDNTKAIERNDRHLDGLMGTVWPLIWRVSSIEDWLEDHPIDNDKYRPPKLMPQQPDERDR